MVRRGSLNLVVLLVASGSLLTAGCCLSGPGAKCPFAAAPRVQRHGAVIAIPKENIPEYKKLHAATWPGVLKMIDKAHIDDYSIYLGEVAPDQFYLFSYYEYTGRNFAADMARMKEDKTTQEWWKRTDPLQRPLPTRQEGEWWAEWKEVFHHDGPAYQESQVKSRHGSIIGMPEKNILAYTQMHAAVWPGVLAAIDRANIRNYSIYLGQIKPGEYLLFSYFEYIGDDFKADMAGIADEVTKTWWTYTDPLQVRLPGTPEGEQWKAMEEVFHTD
jgi:L-rhamnose mutarotase